MGKKIIIFCSLSIFTFFCFLLFAESQGYYKSRSEKAKVLTDTEIKKFEKDVSLGRKIDIKEYTLYKDKDYTNNVSNDIYTVSLKLESIFDTTIKLIFNNASKAVNG